MITQSKLNLASSATNLLHNLNCKDQQTDQMIKFLEEKEQDPALSKEELAQIKVLKADCAKLYEITAQARNHLKTTLTQFEQGEVFSVAEAMQDFLPYL